MRVRVLLVYFDLAFVIACIALFVASSADKAAHLPGMLAAGPGPILAALNVGVSISTVIDKRKAAR
jgi:hypothetical protein